MKIINQTPNKQKKKKKKTRNSQQINLQLDLNTLTHTCKLTCANCAVFSYSTRCAWLDVAIMFIIFALFFSLFLFTLRSLRFFFSVSSNLFVVCLYTRKHVLVVFFYLILFVCVFHFVPKRCPFTAFNRSKSKPISQ